MDHHHSSILILAILCCQTLASPLSDKISSDHATSTSLADQSELSQAIASQIGFGQFLPGSSSKNINSLLNPSTNTFQPHLSRSYRWAMVPTEDLINALSSRLAALSHPPASLQPHVAPYSTKRSCSIDAGLNNNCFFQDFISANKARKLWESNESPGKRSGSRAQMNKRMNCMVGLPGGDCENSFLDGESLGQDFLRPGGRNPGRR